MHIYLRHRTNSDLGTLPNATDMKNANVDIDIVMLSASLELQYDLMILVTYHTLSLIIHG